MTPASRRKLDLLENIQAVLMGDCRLDPRLPVVTGFSGGADSLCLLGLLAELGWQVTAANFDHQLRAESGMDAQRAAQLAQRLGVPFVQGMGDVRGFADTEGLNIEDAARRMRYAFLFETARKESAQAVCTAHTADDQAETLLLHLLRGAGLNGLKGMPALQVLPEWDEVIPLARPILGLTRADTESWCRVRGLDPVIDLSNLDITYTRNRIRHELLPELETFNPNIRRVLARSASILAGEHAVVAAAVEREWEALRRGEGGGWTALDHRGLRLLDENLLRAVLRQAAARLCPGLADLDYEDIQRAAKFVRGKKGGGPVDLACGLVMFVEEGRLYLAEAGSEPPLEGWPQLAPGQVSEMPVPGGIWLGNGWEIRAELVGLPSVFSGDRSEAWLDAGKLDGPLSVRAARPGERLQPLGMQGTQKLSDLWVNLRVPRRARASYPLVCRGDRVAWIPGLRAAEPFRVEAATQEVVHLQIIRGCLKSII